MVNCVRIIIINLGFQTNLARINSIGISCSSSSRSYWSTGWYPGSKTGMSYCYLASSQLLISSPSFTRNTIRKNLFREYFYCIDYSIYCIRSTALKHLFLISWFDNCSGKLLLILMGSVFGIFPGYGTTGVSFLLVLGMLWSHDDGLYTFVFNYKLIYFLNVD